METLTKAWGSEASGPRQRSVAEMRADHRRYGTGGNCFDLALWLLDDLAAADVAAYAIGPDVETDEAHVAVLAGVDGVRWLCDLGDMWIWPAPIDELARRGTQPTAGYFPAARIAVESSEDRCRVTYHRPQGHVSHHMYGLAPIDPAVLGRAAAASQARLRRPLCERRLYRPATTDHWEFDDGRSFVSTDSGWVRESTPPDDAAWVERIQDRTGIAREVVASALRVYRAQPR